MLTCCIWQLKMDESKSKGEQTSGWKMSEFVNLVTLITPNRQSSIKIQVYLTSLRFLKLA